MGMTMSKGVEGSSPKADGKSSSKAKDRLSNLVEHGIHKAGKFGSRMATKVKNFNPKSASKLVIDAPNALKKEYKRAGPSGVITKFPALTIAIFLFGTLFFVYHSGFMDIDDANPRPWQIKKEPSLNVNGSLDVYLPEGDPVADAIAEVQKDWSTNVLIIYVELNGSSSNITDRGILLEIDRLEKKLNYLQSDPSDDVDYILSLSTVVKEVNSSAPRVTKAFIEEAGELGCNNNDDCLTRDVAGQLSEQVNDWEWLLGEYSIPSQDRISQIIDQMYDCYDEDGVEKCEPTPGLDKLARDTDGDGNLDRAVIIVAVNESKETNALVNYYRQVMNELSSEERPCDPDETGGETCTWAARGLEMSLTGPVPITNAVTEFSFKLFWKIFPIAVVLVALGLFVFHSDLLQTGSIRAVQGIKVIIIAGLPTLCSVFWTLGIIGWLGYEVTMTVIIVGPILLALGVSYGLHITNRYAEESGDPYEKMRIAFASTGKAVFLSAVTTVIGFISLTFTPMAPIATVGWALSGGIIVVYFLTMIMVPNLTILLDLKKAKHPPLPVFDAAVDIPLKWNIPVLAVFILLIGLSGTWGMDNVEENIDLLGMAPEDEPAVKKMKQYSSEFEAGQIGMLLIEGHIKGDSDDNIPENDDPFKNLQGIENLSAKLNLVDHTSAVSIVFLMKSVGVSVNLSGTDLQVPCELLPDGIDELCELIIGNEVDDDLTFWRLLEDIDRNPALTENSKQRQQIFLLNVFYNSLTDETRYLFTEPTYGKSLIYIDMPFLPVKDTEASVIDINQHAKMTYAEGNVRSGELTGVAAVAIAVNSLIVDSQWSSLAFAVILTLITLGIVFKDLRFALWTTLPVVATVALQWLVMAYLDVSLSLVTVMIGSILVGVGVDFSIHIANRIRELGGGIEAIRTATVSTGMSLFEAATVTTLGLVAAYQIPIPEIQPFVTVVIVLLWIAAASALLLLPAIFVTLEKMGMGSTGGAEAMMRKLGLTGSQVAARDGSIDAVVVMDDVEDVW
jgi:predicted RND superfamily exporter protein